jgi:hypothetical protein
MSSPDRMSMYSLRGGAQDQTEEYFLIAEELNDVKGK